VLFLAVTPTLKAVAAARPTVPSRLPVVLDDVTANVSSPGIPRTALYRLVARIMFLFSIETWLLVLPLAFMVTGALWVPFYGSQYLQVGLFLLCRMRLF
jgi:hypothetical protein